MPQTKSKSIQTKRSATPRTRTTRRTTAPKRRSSTARKPSAAVRVASRLEHVPTGYVVLLMFAVAACMAFYVGHVQATEALLADVQHARQENLRLHLKHNRLKGEFDHLTGPSVIYRRAKELGLVEGYTYGPTIVTYAP